MVQAGKKRNAKAKVNPKPTKTIKKEEEQVEIHDTKTNDLFDNLDEEMDPNQVEDYMHQLEDEESDLEEDQTDLEDQAESENEADLDHSSLEKKEEEEELQEAEEEENKEESVPEQQSVAKRFRDLYMTRVTQAFGSDLDQIRQEPTLNGPRLNILIDSLEAGIDIFSSLEQEIEL